MRKILSWNQRRLANFNARGRQAYILKNSSKMESPLLKSQEEKMSFGQNFLQQYTERV